MLKPWKGQLYRKIGDQIAPFFSQKFPITLTEKKNQNGGCYKKLVIEISINKKVASLEKKDSRSVNKFWDLCSCLKGSQLIAKTL